MQFAERAHAALGQPLRRGRATTLQVNVGKRCNQACHHCHVEAGPKRTEMMTREVAARVMELLDGAPEIETVDITGGAPELNPHFRWLVAEARRRGRRVIDRCNLTVMFEPGMDDLPAFLAEQRVAVIASLPCYGPENVDKQRGLHVFDKSIAALRTLNALGYGRPNSALELHLVYNPVGAHLPPAQETLEARYHEVLERDHGVQFHHLFTLTNMPIRRFADSLERSGQYQQYMSLLVQHFNPAAVPAVMCRTLVSVGWDGELYDCDFNQMLEMPLGNRRRTVFDITTLAELAGEKIATGAHCYGCTAGSGSSCGGALT